MNSARGGFDSSFDSQNSYMSGKSDGGGVFDPKMGQYGSGQFAQQQQQQQRGQNSAPQSKGMFLKNSKDFLKNSNEFRKIPKNSKNISSEPIRPVQLLQTEWQLCRRRPDIGWWQWPIGRSNGPVWHGQSERRFYEQFRS